MDIFIQNISYAAQKLKQHTECVLLLSHYQGIKFVGDNMILMHNFLPIN